MLTIRHYRGVQLPAPVELTARVKFLGYSLSNFRTVKAFPRPRDPSVLSIQQAVANHFDIPLREMWSARRNRAIARPRQVAMFLCRQHTRRSLPDIGRRFGNRDHTTVIHAIRQVEHLRLVDGEFAADVLALEERLA